MLSALRACLGFRSHGGWV